MARTALQDAIRITDAQSFASIKREIRSAATTIKAKFSDLQALQVKWTAGIADGLYDQADLDELNAALSVFSQYAAAIDAYLAQGAV